MKLTNTRGQFPNIFGRAFRVGIVMVTLTALGLVSAPAMGQSRGLTGLREMQDAFREIARKVKPAVVNVSTVKIVEAA